MTASSHALTAILVVCLLVLPATAAVIPGASPIDDAGISGAPTQPVPTAQVEPLQHDSGHASGTETAQPSPKREAAMNQTAQSQQADGTPDDEIQQYKQQTGMRSLRANKVHARGITGQGVRVGVIGSGFTPNHSATRDHVAASQVFGTRSYAHESADHGTAVAEVVADTAPGSRLYLASIGTRPTPAQYRAAVQWLVDNGVDVIVDSGSYFPGQTSETVTAAAENASQQGIVFVTSAGNYADRHWTGNGTDIGWVNFDQNASVQANPLADGNTTKGEVSLRLQWNASADYDLYLYRHLTNGPDRVVAKSTQRQLAGAETMETISVAVPRGTYYVGIYAYPVGETAPTDRLQLFSVYQSLGYTVSQGSVVAPATSDRVIVVGAVDQHGQRRAYSSLGINNSTVDVSAPDGIQTRVAGPFYGTSASAPYVAGIIALMKSRNGGLSPSQVEQILERTADTNGTRIDALAAVKAAGNATTEETWLQNYRDTVDRSP